MVHKKDPKVLPDAYDAYGANVDMNNNDANHTRSGNFLKYCRSAKL